MCLCRITVLRADVSAAMLGVRWLSVGGGHGQTDTTRREEPLTPVCKHRAAAMMELNRTTDRQTGYKQSPGEYCSFSAANTLILMKLLHSKN